MPNRTQQSQPVMLLSPVVGSVDAYDLLIYGDIGESWLGESISAAEVVQQLLALPAQTRTINVRINSYGGSVSDGLAIYNALKRHPARKVVTVDGVAMSSASLIAMAGDDRLMPASAVLMIHAPWAVAQGNAQDMRDMAGVLDTFATAMSSAYADASGKTFNECLSLLQDGLDHYYTGEDALAEGFATALEQPQNGEGKQPNPAAAGPRLLRLVASAPTHIRDLAIHGALSSKAFQKRPVWTGDSNMTHANRSQVPAASGNDAEVHARIRDRAASIRASLEFYMNRDGIRELYAQALEDPSIPEREIMDRAMNILGRGAEPIAGWYTPDAPSAGIRYGSGKGHEDAFHRAAADAIVMRAGMPLAKPHAGARDFMAMSITDIARTCLSRAGVAHSHLTPSQVLGKGGLTTSDFPAIMLMTVQQTIKFAFDQEPASYRIWVGQVEVPDFKEYSDVLIGAGPDLLKVPEGGEYSAGSIDEDTSLPYKVETYGRIVYLTRQLMINDNAGALLKKIRQAGQAAARLEASMVYDTFAENGGAGPTMGDGKALFHVDHGNLLSAQSGLSAESLGAARVLLRRQKAITGTAMNLEPRVLLVPPELEQTAEILLAASAQRLSQGADNTLSPNWLASLALAVEPRLPENAFYLLASPTQVDTYQLAHLLGETAPQVIENDDFDRDVTGFKVRFDVGGRWLDYRGAVKVPIS